MYSMITIIFGITVFNAGFLPLALADNFQVRLGDSVTLPCLNQSELDGLEIFSVTWTHEAKPADQNTIVLSNPVKIFVNENYRERASYDNDSFTLTLNGVNFEDKGEYRCQAFAGDDILQMSQTISVYVSPSVTVRVHPQVLSLRESTGDKRLAVCNAIGASPPIEMKWIDATTNEVVINDTSRIESVNLENAKLVDSKLILSFDATAAADNERAFTCIVTDRAREEITRNTAISVTTLPKFASFPQENVIVELGETRTIACRANGIPTPTVSWYRGSLKLTEDFGESLLILSPQSYDEDRQSYQCTARNKAGKIDDFIQLEVQGKPIMITEDPENKTELLNLYHDKDEVSLTCIASGSPLPEMIWKIEDTNSTQVVEDEAAITTTVDGYFVTSVLKLDVQKYIRSLKKIICEAENYLGSDSREWIALVSSPTMEEKGGGVGWIVGIVIAVVFLIFLVGLIYFLHRRRTSKSEDLVEKGWCSFCTCRKTKKLDLEGQDNDQIKEVCEEKGTKEEKRQLTEAEEKPDSSQEIGTQLELKQDEENGDADTSDPTEANEEPKEKKKRKLKIYFLSSQCCKKTKKQLKEEESMEEKKIAPDDDQKVLEDNKDADSGKGDTLEKIVDN